jgi:hypothetical protein
MSKMVQCYTKQTNFFRERKRSAEFCSIVFGRGRKFGPIIYARSILPFVSRFPLREVFRIGQPSLPIFLKFPALTFHLMPGGLCGRRRFSGESASILWPQAPLGGAEVAANSSSVALISWVTTTADSLSWARSRVEDLPVSPTACYQAFVLMAFHSGFAANTCRGHSME